MVYQRVMFHRQCLLFPWNIQVSSTSTYKYGESLSKAIILVLYSYSDFNMKIYTKYVPFEITVRITFQTIKTSQKQHETCKATEIYFNDNAHLVAGTTVSLR